MLSQRPGATQELMWLACQAREASLAPGLHVVVRFAPMEVELALSGCRLLAVYSQCMESGT